MLSLVLALAATSPLTYGAVADDGLDDGPAIRSAVAAACNPNGDHVVEFPVGTFHVAKFDSLSAIPIANCQDLRLRGEGSRSTRIVQVPKVTVTGEDYYAFNVTSSANVVFEGLTLDGSRSQMSGPAEQVHLIRTYNVDFFEVRGVEFVESYGDGVKLIETHAFAITDCRFRNLNRGGITVHAGNRDGVIDGNVFGLISDQHIDVEPSGSSPSTRISITNNAFREITSSSRIAVAIAGVYTKGFTVTHNVFDDGQLQVVYADGVVVANNVFTGTSTVSPLLLKGDATGIVVSGNDISTGGSCLVITGMDNNRLPGDVAVTGNTCTAANHGVYWNGGGFGNLVVANNKIKVTSTTGTTYGVYITTENSNAVPLKHVVVDGNVLIDVLYGVWLVARFAALDVVNITDNVVDTTRTSSRGVTVKVWNHLTPPAPYPVNCRVSDNVFLTTTQVYSGPESTGPMPGPGEGCISY